MFSCTLMILIAITGRGMNESPCHIQIYVVNESVDMSVTVIGHSWR